MHVNRLAGEKSPYLLQHAHNPVDWYPWGEEAFAKARQEDKAIFLSIGYSTCHWCHVMERESFEDEATAEALNRWFVSIKLDREERPDIDRIYMAFVQAATGGGGWPMSVWLTPELKPFFGGTYFPPDGRRGRPGFRTVLEYIAKAWHGDRERLIHSSNQVIEAMERMAAAPPPREHQLDPSQTLAAISRRLFDARHGGFGEAPKFPRPVLLDALLRHGSRECADMAAATLKAMARGGMRDQVGGGFHRYSVDERWFVPHFEKMLYDQAQLAISYVEAWQITREPVFAGVARDTLDYVLREMRDPTGAFHSAEDADSAVAGQDPKQKREGAFYLWKWSELVDALGADGAARIAQHYGARESGNVDNDPHGEFTGGNILYEIEAGCEAERAKLRELRQARPRPHRDDKVLTAWNALMISALARAGAALDEPRYTEAARVAADFILGTLWNAESRTLLRRYRDGDAAIAGVLDDYAFLAQALADLYQATFDQHYLGTAITLGARMVELFEDPARGAFFSTPSDVTDVVVRLKDEYDGAEPSGNSIATLALLRLAALAGRDDFRASAERTLKAFDSRLAESPVSIPEMYVAWKFATSEMERVTLSGGLDNPELQAMAREARVGFAPHRVLLHEDKEGEPAAMVCVGKVCQLPVAGAVRLRESLPKWEPVQAGAATPP